MISGFIFTPVNRNQGGSLDQNFPQEGGGDRMTIFRRKLTKTNPGDRPKGGLTFWGKSHFWAGKSGKIPNFDTVGAKIFENFSIIEKKHDIWLLNE